jgi:hypothetical protein
MWSWIVLFFLKKKCFVNLRGDVLSISLYNLSELKRLCYKCVIWDLGSFEGLMLFWVYVV